MGIYHSFQNFFKFIKRIKSVFLFLLSVSAIFLAGTNSVLAQAGVEKPYHDGVVIVKFKPEFKYLADNKDGLKSIFETTTGKSELLNVEREFPNSPVPLKEKNKFGVKTVDISGIYRVSFDTDKDVQAVIAGLSKMKYFEYAEPLYKVELFYVPDDPKNQTSQYWLTSIRAFDAWDVHQGDTNIVIGISDTGIDLSHPELIYQIKYNYNDMPDGIDNDLDGFVDNFRGWNFGENNNNVQSDASHHGTWVSGIAGAATDNGIGVSGAGFKCKILPIKVMNSDTVIENAYQSIVYAADHGCDVVNCSWGGSYFQQMAQDVVNYATINYDLLIVSAAGNTNSDVKTFPASYENVLSVAGTQTEDQKWSPDNSISTKGSSYSYYVDVCAPATNFESTENGGGYTLMWGGTSFASPIVAGCAGLLRSYFPDYSANQIAELLKISADLIDTIPYNIPYAGKLGHGRVNLYNALTMVQTPSVVFENISVSEIEGTVTVSGNFTNYLADAENLTISAELLSDYATVQNTEIFSGNLAEMESFNEDGIVIVLDQDIPYDYKTILKFVYAADNYSSEQVIELYVNPGYKNIITDNLKLSVTPEGRFGYSDVGSTIGEGFVLNEVFSLFYDCGIISGFSPTELYCSVRQQSDFVTVKYPEFVENSENADYQISTEFTDSNDVSPKGIRILEDVYSWSGYENEDYIITDFQIINESPYDFTDFYFGLFTDWDLVEASANSADIDPDNNFIYVKSDNSQTMYAGIKLLSNQELKNYALSQSDGGDGIIDVSDGFTDIEKFHMISNSNSGYSGDPTDIVAYTGAGPFDIPSGDTVVAGFAFIAAESLFNIQNALSQSRHKYDEILHPQNIHNDVIKGFNVYPNPVTDFLTVVPENNSINAYSLELYNSIGELVLSGEYSGESTINLKDFSEGIYMVKVVTSGRIFIKKVTRLN